MTSTWKTPNGFWPAKSKYEDNVEAQRKNMDRLLANAMQVGKNWILPKGVITKRKQRAKCLPTSATAHQASAWKNCTCFG